MRPDPQILKPALLVLLMSHECLALSASQAEKAFGRAMKSMEIQAYESAAKDFAIAVQLEPKQARYQCGYAFAARFAGLLDAARTAIQRCLALDANARGAHYLAGDIEAASRHFEAAVPYLREALKREPNNSSVLGALGGALSTLGRSDEAATYFRRITQLEPRYADDYYNLGVALLQLSEPESAEEAFREALKLSSRYPKAQIGLSNSILEQSQTSKPARLREAVAGFQQAISLAPQDPEAHVSLAFALELVADVDGAIAEYQQALRLQPNPSLASLARFNLGVLYFGMQNWSAAQEHLQQAAALDENNSNTQYYLGSTFLKIGNKGDAEKHLLAALQLNPGDYRIHFQLGTLYRSTGDYKRSSAEYEKYRQLSAQEDSKERTFGLEHSAKLILKGSDPSKAIPILRQLYQARPDAVSARNLALVLVQTGEVSEARQLLEKALELSPRDAATYNYLGLLEANQSNLDAAERYFETAAALDPSYEDALYNAGVAAAQLGRYQIAGRHLQAALAISDTPRVRNALAVVYAEAGLLKESALEFEAAQRLEAKTKGKQPLIGR